MVKRINDFIKLLQSIYRTPKIGPWCSPEMLGQVVLHHCQWWRHKQGIQHFSAAKATETQREPTIMARKTPNSVLWILIFSSLVVLYFRIVWKVHKKEKQNKQTNHNIWWRISTFCKTTEAFLLEIRRVDERQTIALHLHWQIIELYQQLGMPFCPPYLTFHLQ